MASTFEAYSQRTKRACQLSFQAATSFTKVNKCRESYAKLKEDQKIDEERLEQIRITKVRWDELEKELSEVKSKCCALMRNETEFRQELSQVQTEIKQEEPRLAIRVAQMRQWHEESMFLHREAAQICEEWEKAPQVNISSLLS
ncbi:hypothetical protein M5689_003270 [Euphorbia peplus]|nr:hypothetical protein M5689_003270 [Euphorbia peplus]